MVRKEYIASRVTKEIKDWLFQKAKKEERTMSWLITKVIEREMLKDKQKKAI